jgi:hypothetical protein
MIFTWFSMVSTPLTAVEAISDLSKLQGNYYIAFASLTLTILTQHELTRQATVHPHQVSARLRAVDEVHQYSVGVHIPCVAGDVLLALDG